MWQVLMYLIFILQNTVMQLNIGTLAELVLLEGRSCIMLYNSPKPVKFLFLNNKRHLWCRKNSSDAITKQLPIM